MELKGTAGRRRCQLELRTENTGALASQVASLPNVRAALLRRQQLFAKEPGLVADGRDMGTVVFPEAPLKIYLTASAEERAQRRYKELLAKGENVSLRALEEQVRSRDERDMSRDASPLIPAADASAVRHLGIIYSRSDGYSAKPGVLKRSWQTSNRSLNGLSQQSPANIAAEPLF